MFEDISDPSFDAAKFGLDNEQLIMRLHGILPDGRVVEGMQAFRAAYTALGFGWLLAPTGWPVLRPICDACYKIFARIRPKLQRNKNTSCPINTNYKSDTHNGQKRSEKVSG